MSQINFIAVGLAFCRQCVRYLSTYYSISLVAVNSGFSAMIYPLTSFLKAHISSNHSIGGIMPTCRGKSSLLRNWHKDRLFLRSTKSVDFGCSYLKRTTFLSVEPWVLYNRVSWCQKQEPEAIPSAICIFPQPPEQSLKKTKMNLSNQGHNGCLRMSQFRQRDGYPPSDPAPISRPIFQYHLAYEELCKRIILLCNCLDFVGLVVDVMRQHYLGRCLTFERNGKDISCRFSKIVGGEGLKGSQNVVY